MGWPIVIVESGGIAVTEAANGLGAPVTVATNGLGTAVTVVASGGFPVHGTGGVPVWTAYGAPRGFAYAPPFTVEVSSLGAARTNFNMAAAKPTPTHTIYCGAGGDNANNGTSWALRVRSLKQAMVRANAAGTSASIVRILAQVGEYWFSNVDGSAIPDSFAGQICTRAGFSIEPCDASGNPVATGNIVSIHNQVMPAFSLVSGSIYASTYTTEVPSKNVWDRSILDTFGEGQGLSNVSTSLNGNEAGILAAVEARHTLLGIGALYLDTTAKKLYVRLANGRAPDSNMVVGRGSALANDATARNLYLNGRFGASNRNWLDRVRLHGGCGLYAPSYNPDGQFIELYWADGATLYSCNNGLAFDGGGTITLLRHNSSYSFKDGYNYDQSSGMDPSGISTLRFHEIDCSGIWNGADNNSNDASSNYSSAHLRSRGVRINPRGRKTQNRAIHDINQVRSWNVGGIIADAQQTGVQSAAVASGYLPNSGETTRVWCHALVSLNNPYDLEAYKGGVLKTAAMDTTGYVNDTDGGSGTITTYDATVADAPNIVVNGDFAAGTTSWTGFGFSGKSVANGKATFATTPAFDDISQTASFTAGKYYEVSYAVTRTAGSILPRTVGGTGVNGTERSAAGTYVERILAASGNTSLSFLPGASGFTGTLDDITWHGPYDTSTVGGL